MDLDRTNRWLTLATNLGVIGGIVFLAIEIGQNQASLEQANRINVLDARTTEVQHYNDFRIVVAQDKELSEIWTKGNSGDALDPSETARFVLLCNSYLWIGVSTYERSVELGRATTAQGHVRLRGQALHDKPGYRRCWDNERAMISEYGFSDYVEAVEAIADAL